MTLCQALGLPAPDGTVRQVDCTNIEGIFRIVQSITTPKAEVLKCWLAEAGQKRKGWPGQKVDLDSIFIMLGEAATAEIIRKQDVQRVDANRMAAPNGGKSRVIPARSWKIKLG